MFNSGLSYRKSSSLKKKRGAIGGKYTDAAVGYFEEVTGSQRALAAMLALAVAALVISLVMLMTIYAKDKSVNNFISNELNPLIAISSRLCHPNLTPRLLSDIDR